MSAANRKPSPSEEPSGEAAGQDPELRPLVEAFEAGDYRAVRDGTARLIADASTNEPLRAAARELRARTEPDPLQVWLLVLAAAVVLALSGYEIARHTHPVSSPPPRPTVERVR